jgi:hypothetical protein
MHRRWWRLTLDNGDEDETKDKGKQRAEGRGQRVNQLEGFPLLATLPQILLPRALLDLPSVVAAPTRCL